MEPVSGYMLVRDVDVVGRCGECSHVPRQAFDHVNIVSRVRANQLVCDNVDKCFGRAVGDESLQPMNASAHAWFALDLNRQMDVTRVVWWHAVDDDGRARAARIQVDTKHDSDLASFKSHIVVRFFFSRKQFFSII